MELQNKTQAKKFILKTNTFFDKIRFEYSTNMPTSEVRLFFYFKIGITLDKFFPVTLPLMCENGEKLVGSDSENTVDAWVIRRNNFSLICDTVKNRLIASFRIPT